MRGDLPSAVLFCCTFNAIRSPMAEGIFRWLHGKKCYVDSVGLKTDDLDPFAVAVMDEIGIDISDHKPKSFDELEDDSFDIIISLSPEAQHRAVELTRTTSCDVEFWPTFDPTLVEGSRESRMEAYRQVRDELHAHILKRFPLSGRARD